MTLRRMTLQIISVLGNLIVSVMFDLPVMHVIIVDTNCTSTVLECE